MEVKLGVSQGTQDQWIKADVLIQEQDLAALLFEHGQGKMTTDIYNKLSTNEKYLLMTMEAERLIEYTKAMKLNDPNANAKFQQLQAQIIQTVQSVVYKYAG